MGVVSFGIILLLMVSTLKTDENGKEEKYPKGTYLLKELKNIYTYDNSIYIFNMERIDPYIFRDYVYRYEIIAGFSREVALRKAFEKYKKDFF